ncbi:hypothetical protein RclHR1_11220004 [Rhizophagus clarus]|uniref:Uncharacterized protein n=1 Tax=Rhizophagus clarus TaxID=94130 RepID=A0A2Z6Q595_9GLOM|nr:hypothetical protein RclHR1_11220004 [Rhizophagus clarus]GES84867.1 hypothetical protein GLOIN_2v1781803 [Rhizophagus clarus]
MVRLINNFTVVCREIINNELVNVNYVSENPENCHCDFRINLRYCKGEQIYIIATWILVIYSILIGCISMYFLYHQIFIVGQSLFFPPSKLRGVLRPRPQETFHLICFSCNLLQIIHLLFKLFDGYQNTLHAELYLDIPRLVSYALATLYPISIIHSTPNVDPSTTAAIRWTPNKYLIDIVGFSLMICPFISNIPLAIYTGHYADINEIEKANFFFKIHYIMWSFWTFVYLITLIIFWYKLITILNNHIKLINNRRDNGIIFDERWKVEKLKKSVKNLTAIVASFGSIFLLYSILCLVSALFFKSTTIYNVGLNITAMFIMNYVIPVSFNIAQFVIIYHKLRPSRRNPTSTPLTVFSPKRQTDQSHDDDDEADVVISEHEHDHEDNEITSITTSKRKPKPLESILHHFNDDNNSISNRSNISIISNKSSHNELFSYHHLNKSDKQIYRYSNNSSPKSFKFNYKYSSGGETSTLIGTNNNYRHNSLGISSLNSTFLGSSSNLSSPSDRDEFYINGNSPLKINFDVNIQKEVNFNHNNNNNSVTDDDDDSIYNIDRKEWLAKKPRRIPLKKCTM